MSARSFCLPRTGAVRSAAVVLAGAVAGLFPTAAPAGPPGPTAEVRPAAVASDSPAPVPSAVKDEFALSDFYRKALVRGGLPIVSSAKVSDAALREAAHVVDALLSGRDDLRRAIVRQKVRLAVMSPTEFTTDVPEHSDLVPAGYWNKRARGLGATRARPAVSCGEENLLNLAGDPYQGESILIHEFAHVIHEIGLSEVDPTFDARLRTAYEAALADGRWKGTYAAENRSEYWAEGVQIWFHANRTRDRQHGDVGTRADLRKYDPPLAALLAEVFRGNDWRYVPTDRRSDAPHLAGFDRSKAPRFEWPRAVLDAFEQAERERRGGERRKE